MHNIIGITGRKFTGKDTIGHYFVNNGYQKLAFADPLKEVARIVFGFNDEQLFGSKKEEIDKFWGFAPRKAFQIIGTNLFRKNFYKYLKEEIAKELNNNNSDDEKNRINETLDMLGACEKAENIWVMVLKKHITDKIKDNPSAKFVITDIRFPNELQAIKDLGGCTIKVQRDNAMGQVNRQIALNNITSIGLKLSNASSLSPQDIVEYINQLEQAKKKLEETNAKTDTHESEALIDGLETDIVIDNNDTMDALYKAVIIAMGTKNV